MPSAWPPGPAGFDEHHLGAIIDHLATHGDPSDLVRADENHSAQPGTGA